jgi:aminopeptidase N
MTEWTYDSEHPGASELFRAHEVAHTWWGHKVGWKSYRDQWLSEAFAEYSAMMFVHDHVKNGPKYFQEILRSYEGIVKGNLAGGFSKFNRPSLIERSSTQRNRLGPIGHGWRASTSDIPAGYTIQTYHKGPLVVHMMRMLLRQRTGNDEMFIKTMRDFLAEYDGKVASTEDFRRVLERTSSTDFGWFFDSWIYGAEIPTFVWDYTVKQEGDAHMLTIDVERRDVSDGFVTPIPVRVEFDGDKMAYLFLPSKGAKETFTRKLPAKPKNVVFAPDSSLLSNVKRK